MLSYFFFPDFLRQKFVCWWWNDKSSRTLCKFDFGKTL